MRFRNRIAIERGSLMYSMTNSNRAICCLYGYGAWEPAELEEATDRELATKILWLACGNFSEWYTEADAAGVTPDNIPDDFHPNCGSDIFCLE